MNQNFSDKDKKDWENFLSSKEKLIDKDNYIKKRKTNKILDIDLHGYTLDDANKKIVINYMRFSGTLNALVGKNSWYRPD